MISRIILNGVASYRLPATLETDKKVNIIYGLNGTGKSTFSNFLYDTSNVNYQNCSVTRGDNEELIVYNQQFIRDNFVESDGLHGIFSLSKENKEIEGTIKSSEKELEELHSKVDKKNTEIKEYNASIQKITDAAYEKLFEIKRLYTGGDRVLEYCLDNLKRKEPLFNYIVKIGKPKEKPIKGINEIKRDVESINSDTAKKYEPLQTLDLLTNEIESNVIFSEIIIGSSDSPVSVLIARLENSDWVKKGLEYLPEDQSVLPSTCPFCQEKTITKEILSWLKNYFDESYEKSINTIDNLIDQYNLESQSFLSLDVYKASEFSKKYISELTQSHASLKRDIDSNIAAMRKKRENPSTKITLVKTNEALANFNSVLILINKEIEANNNRITNRVQELSKLKVEFWDLMRWEYDQTISPYLSETKKLADTSKKLEENKVEIESSISKKTAEIVELQKTTVNIEEAITNINNGLVQLGISDFEIDKFSENKYRIVRGDRSNSIFTSLSEGEKMIISFLYFCELCKGKKSATETRKKKIAIIDDPVSSLSHIYVYNVGQMLKSNFFKSDVFEQVFVLTHSLYFFYELADSNHKRRKDNQKLFRLSKNTNTSNIKIMKYEEVQNDYHSYWTIINDENQPPALIANCMRNVIEYFFNFVQKADLSNVIQKPELQANRYQAFCRYINRESHSLGQNIFDFKEFNYDDFREGLKLVFQVTGYPEHYQKMVNSITA